MIPEIILKRKTVFPKQFIKKEISREVLLEILDAANWAPTHKKTEPWRFRVLSGSWKNRLSEFLVETFKAISPPEMITDKKLQDIGEKALLSDKVVLLSMITHPELLPEWEELAATAMAAQNFWLACTQHGIGTYWASPPMIHHLHKFIPLEENEKYLGIFYMGYFEDFEIERKRKPISEKVKFYND